MASNIMNPIIPFNLIVDTDIGIVKHIRENYDGLDRLFYKGLLDSPDKALIYLMQKRTDENPLTVLSNGNKDSVDIFYDNVMNEDYKSVIEHSITTNLYEALKLYSSSDVIIPSVYCKNDIEANAIEKITKDFGNINIETDELSKVVHLYDPVYFKSYKDMKLDVMKNLDGKNVYLADFAFNYDAPDDNGKSYPKVALLLAALPARLTMTSLYNIDESYIPKG